MSVREFISPAAFSCVSEDDPSECAYSFSVRARMLLNRYLVGTGCALKVAGTRGGARKQSRLKNGDTSDRPSKIPRLDGTD